MSPIPDPPCGLRFCRQCNEFKPLSEFPAGKRRYQCRKHAQERCKISRAKGFSKQPLRRALARVWHAAYMDARAVFSQKGMKLTQADVAKLFRERDVEPCHRVLPADPLRALAGDNAVVVSRGARKKLIREWLRNGNVGQYGAMLLVEAGSLDTEGGNSGADGEGCSLRTDGASCAAGALGSKSVPCARSKEDLHCVTAAPTESHGP